MEIDHSAHNQPLVAVIGGGISGLICARTLLDHKYRVTIFESNHKPGGRLSTRRTCKFSFDHGAQYFTVKDPRFRGYVDSWIANGVVTEWYGDICVLENGKVSETPETVQRYIGIPGMHAVAQHVANCCEVVTEVTVSNLKKEGEYWRLRSDKGEILGHYNYVVAAVPGPQASILLSEAPKIARPAASVKMLGCWAVLLAFDSPLNLPFDAAFVHKSSLSWIALDSSKAGRDNNECWVLHGSPEWSEEHKNEEPSRVVDLLLDEFNRTTYGKFNPSFSSAHFWRYATPVNPLEDRYLFDPDLSIGACGDWCAGPRVEGAFLSGLELANRIIFGS
jgi:renalase